jgi:septal ring factor EnvC (AmiA/AmiB activator)
LERERCKVTQLRKDLDEEKKTHEEDVEDFERQMREMEVQLSKERADIARQRSELQRMQAEVRAELEAVHRGDGALRDRLAQIQRSVHEPNGNGRAPSGGPPANAAARKEKDSGLMQRLFGKK